MRLGRLRTYLMLLIAAAAVVVSWTVPEPPTPVREPVVPVSNTACSADYSAPPSYGTRSLTNRCSR